MLKMNQKLTIKLVVIACLMFGFGFYLVPLYDVFCKVTGFGGRTGTIEQAQAENAEVDPNRLVRVQFSSHASSNLPWDFYAHQREVELKPGKIYEFFYTAKNNSDREITGQSLFNVTPPQAGAHLKKLECFCFTQQTLKPREERKMSVRLMVDSELPINIKELTLGYSFFKARS